ncbi:HK97 family phage prohead protease [Glycomyces lechevalierae]|uniref:HK97 family phage prohead protease n=2 Tax=Bacteria TaxID=2 RepID=A0ABU2AIM9_9ACTN|nr:HK97 family phage prohead protease [Glycomyces lechevalierae]MDR7336830.1 HK97 family phage prohead protease [Glycomyces lechevalierae]
MDTKSLHVEIKDADKGEVEALFSTYNVIDKDGDVTLPGAFDDGAPAKISAYGHASWSGVLPVGKGTINDIGTGAVMRGKFFLDTTAGKDTFTTVKELGPLQEWSYGYDVIESEFGEFEGKHVRFLKKLKVHEVSPVLIGAGVGTMTMSAKSAPAAKAVRRAVPVHETAVASGPWDAPKTAAALPDDLRPSQLRTVYAWVDPDGDPEAKSSYDFPHHHGVGGPANLRACMAGIAALNGAKGAALSDDDRKAVWEHLASHLKDADREPPALRDRGTSPVKFADELLEGLAGLSGLIDSAARVVALRAQKGKTLSKSNTELLEWIGDDLARLKALIEYSPEGAVDDDEVASLMLRSLAALNDL